MMEFTAAPEHTPENPEAPEGRCCCKPLAAYLGSRPGFTMCAIWGAFALVVGGVAATLLAIEMADSGGFLVPPDRYRTCDVVFSSSLACIETCTSTTNVSIAGDACASMCRTLFKENGDLRAWTDCTVEPPPQAPPSPPPEPLKDCARFRRRCPPGMERVDACTCRF